MSKKKDQQIQTLLNLKASIKNAGYVQASIVEQIIDQCIDYKLEAQGGYELWNAAPSQYLM
jgi:hypothetical protein